MKAIVKKRATLKRRHNRLRRKIKGTADRPRLAVTRSLRHISVQLIDDDKGHTLATASTRDEAISAARGNIEGAKALGTAIAEKAKGLSIESIVFDRGGRQYHGRIKALADAAREAGLQF